jgi:hypothetical protein
MVPVELRTAARQRSPTKLEKGWAALSRRRCALLFTRLSVFFARLRMVERRFQKRSACDELSVVVPASFQDANVNGIGGPEVSARERAFTAWLISVNPPGCGDRVEWDGSFIIFGVGVRACLAALGIVFFAGIFPRVGSGRTNPGLCCGTYFEVLGGDGGGTAVSVRHVLSWCVGRRRQGYGSRVRSPSQIKGRWVAGGVV